MLECKRKEKSSRNAKLKGFKNKNWHKNQRFLKCLLKLRPLNLPQIMPKSLSKRVCLMTRMMLP